MAAPRQAPDVVQFGEFELDLCTGELARDHRRVLLPDQPFRLLALLIRERGTLVTRDTLQHELWSDDTFVDFEAGLNAAIKRLRETLGDAAASPTFIETLPRRGYRFIAPVEERPAPGPAEAEEPASRETAAAPVVVPPVPEASRFQHILDLKLELEQIKEESQSGRVVAVVPARRKRLLWLAAGLAGLLGVAAATWRVMRYPEVRPQPPRLVQVTAMRGWESHPSFSPDGEQVVFDWNGEKQDNWDIYIKLVDSPEVRRLTTDGARDVAPSWSPDGKQIAYLNLRPDQPIAGQAPSTIRVVSPLGGSDRKVSEFPAGGGSASAPTSAPAWSPDGRWLATVGDRGVILVPLQGGEAHPLTSSKEPEFHAPGAFDTDGRYFAYLSCNGPLRCYLEIIGLDAGFVASGSPRRLTRRPICAWGHPVWTRDGQSLVYCDCVTDTLWRVGIAGDRPAERIELAGARAYHPATVASHDRLAFKRNLGDADVYRFETGRPPQPVLDSTLYDERPDLSPDGRRVVFARGGEIWLADSDGTNSVKLTKAGNGPRWSPDGLRIAFDTSDEDGRWHTWTIDADGGSLRRLTGDPGQEFMPSWSRDGRFIYVSSTRGGPTPDIWRVPVASGPAERLTHDANAGMTLESADGRTLYFSGSVSGSGDTPLFALPLDGGPARKIIDCVPGFGFTVGRAGIYHWGCGEEEAGRPLHLLDASTGKTKLLGRLERGFGALTVSSDGKTILYQRMAGAGSDLMMIDNFR